MHTLALDPERRAHGALKVKEMTLGKLNQRRKRQQKSACTRQNMKQNSSERKL